MKELWKELGGWWMILALTIWAILGYILGVGGPIWGIFGGLGWAAGVDFIREGW